MPNVSSLIYNNMTFLVLFQDRYQNLDFFHGDDKILAQFILIALIRRHLEYK